VLPGKNAKHYARIITPLVLIFSAKKWQKIFRKNGGTTLNVTKL
jgi:hypothetical protein